MNFLSYCDLCEAADCYHQRRKLAQTNPSAHGAHLDRIASGTPHPRRTRTSA